MSIIDNTSLLAALTTWGKRPDLASLYPDFIELAEKALNRRLRLRAMETTLASTALVDGAVSLPSGFLAFKELRYDGAPDCTLEPRPLEWIRNQPDSATTPLYFAVTGTQVLCWPTAGSITGTYYKEIPALASFGVNWLLTLAPDLYLAAALEQLFSYANDDAKLAKWAGRRTALIEEIQGADNANALAGGPLTVRAR